MKMVSAAKLKKAESATLQLVPYKEKLAETLGNFLGSLEDDIVIPLAEHRQVRKVAVVVFSSNNGLCGVYNSNVQKVFEQCYDTYRQEIGEDNIIVYAVGKKIFEFLNRKKIRVHESCFTLGEKPTYAEAVAMAGRLTDLFLNKDVDKVELIYNHYKNAGIQVPTRDIMLPVKVNKTENNVSCEIPYIVEPNKGELVKHLVPKVVKTHFYATLLDAFTAEHGARTTAMQIASENADMLVQELRQNYNRVRQEVITNEIIDIVGGAEALRGK